MFGGICRDSMTGGIFHASPVADSGAPAVSPIPPPTRREVLCLGLICPRPMVLSWTTSPAIDVRVLSPLFGISVSTIHISRHRWRLSG